MNVGAIIHKLRKDKKMTLLELSNKSGVALATLSRIENGKMTGTLESHMRICQALEISLPDLYRDMVASTRKLEVQTQKNRTDVFIHDRKAASEILAPGILNKKMMPTLIRIASGGNTPKEETKTGVEKFLYILDGKVEAVIGSEKYPLSKGDTLYFESSVPHYFRNTGKGDARLISVVCPPTL
ncbi:MAG: XRE family transcriptional regulator [Candidatus Omnitrophica bacterium]|nr:XRE family transcriptional regulator [Candidatus Omnitrophota bacterium]MCM8790373.1 XRE family transcriptional regulator [Candidatus Omnitrophota bacterium]